MTRTSLLVSALIALGMGPALAQAPAPAVPIRKDEPKVGRNDPCPCGSGRKYKKCCGAE